MTLIHFTPPSVDEATTGNSLEGWTLCELGLTSENTKVNQPWTLCLLSVEPSFWDKIKSDPNIYVAGESYGKASYYEVALHSSVVPWVQSICLEVDLKYDPTKPSEGHVHVYGREARKRAEARFVDNAAKAIRSERGRGLELCYRKIAQQRHLNLLLEWAILNYDLQHSSADVLRKLAQHLVFLGLNLLERYDTTAAIGLLARSRDEILFGAFRRHLSMRGAKDETPQIISLLQRLLEIVGGQEDFRQHRVFQLANSVNAKICGDSVGITVSNPFGKFNSEEMRKALAHSELFDDEDLGTLDLVFWSQNIINLLPIGKPDGYMQLPAYVLNKLNSAQVDTLRASVTHSSRLRKVMSDWVASSGGSSFYQVLVEEHQEPQTVQELALSLAALLDYHKFLQPAPSELPPPNGSSSLADFDALINGSTLPNEREVIEQMILSFLRVLGMSDLKDEHQEVLQFLANVLGTDPELNPRGEPFSDQHWAQRITHRLSHEDAFDKARHFLLSTCPGPDMVSPRPIASQHALMEAARDFLTASHNLDSIGHVCRLIPFLDPSLAATLLSSRPPSCLDAFSHLLRGNGAGKLPVCDSPLSKAEAIVAIVANSRRRPLPPVWDGTWIFSASSMTIGKIAKRLDQEIQLAICNFTFAEWSAWCCGEQNDLISNFFDAVLKFRNDLARHITAYSLLLLQKELPSQQSLSHWIVSTARSCDTTSYPSEGLRNLLNPIRQRFEKKPLELFPLVLQLSILEMRFEKDFVNANTVNWSNPLSHDFSFLKRVRTVSAEEIGYRVCM